MSLSSSEPSITELLAKWSAGDPNALKTLMPRVHEDLRRIAGRLSEDIGGTLQPTALVNEFFLRLVDSQQVSVSDRSHFFAMSAHIMRHVIVDHARRRQTRKRGGDVVRVPLEDAMAQIGIRPVHDDPTLLALDEAMSKLIEINPIAHRIVELKIFGGFGHQEISDLLEMPQRTVRRRWETAKVILFDLMKHS